MVPVLVWKEKFKGLNYFQYIPVLKHQTVHCTVNSFTELKSMDLKKDCVAALILRLMMLVVPPLMLHLVNT